MRLKIFNFVLTKGFKNPCTDTDLWPWFLHWDTQKCNFISASTEKWNRSCAAVLVYRAAGLQAQRLPPLSVIVCPWLFVQSGEAGSQADSYCHFSKSLHSYMVHSYPGKHDRSIFHRFFFFFYAQHVLQNVAKNPPKQMTNTHVCISRG